MPIRLVISVLKEVQRANKLHHGILFALKNFSGSHFVVGIFGVLKGQTSALTNSTQLNFIIEQARGPQRNLKVKKHRDG